MLPHPCHVAAPSKKGLSQRQQRRKSPSSDSITTTICLMANIGCVVVFLMMALALSPNQAVVVMAFQPPYSRSDRPVVILERQFTRRQPQQSSLCRVACSRRRQRSMALIVSMATNESSASSTDDTPRRSSSLIRSESSRVMSQILRTTMHEDDNEMAVSLGKQHAEQFGLDDDNETEMTCAGLFTLVHAMKKKGMLSLGLSGHPLVLRKGELLSALTLVSVSAEDHAMLFENFFTLHDLERALEEDFLDAARGSTDNRKGWQVRISHIHVRTCVFENITTLDEICSTTKLYSILSFCSDHGRLQSPWRLL